MRTFIYTFQNMDDSMDKNSIQKTKYNEHLFHLV